MPTRPARRWLVLLGLFLFFSGWGTSSFLHLWLDDLARNHAGTFGSRLIEEMTGAYAGWLVFLVLIAVVRRWPISRTSWKRRVPAYFALVVALGLAHTTAMWASRLLLFPLAGLGHYDYGLMRYRYPMELAIQLPNIAVLVALLHAWRWYRGRRERELAAERLERELSQARLERLEAQLRPHFLFNTLNGISSLMYHDPARADLMLGRLSDLLRLTFERTPEPEVALDRELEWLGWYLELMRLRVGERLTITQTVAPDARGVAVPRLLLQPLVENALEHGAARRAGPARVEIRASRQGATLTLEVIDDGPGVADPAAALTAGVGLSNTTERLRTLYGDAGRLTLSNRPEGGLLVSVSLPLRQIHQGGREPRRSTEAAVDLSASVPGW